MPRIVVPPAKVGQPVTASMWETMRAANRQCGIIAGVNCRIKEVPGGTIVDFIAQDADYLCAWQVTLRGSGKASIRPGTINGKPATIGEVALDDEPAPVLDFGQPDLDSKGRGYICAEVTCDPDKQFAIQTVEIVQVADPDSDDGSPSDTPHMGGAARAFGKMGAQARHPLAMLRLRKSGRLVVEQITCFPLQHRVALAKDGKTATRHFFS
jgi:hypothetical protein